MSEGGGFLDHLSDGDSDDGHAVPDAAQAGVSMRQVFRGVGGRADVRTPDMLLGESMETANRHTDHLRDNSVMPSLSQIRESLSRPTTGATRRTSRSASSSSVSAAPDFSVRGVIEEIEGLLEGGKNRDAAWKAVEGIRDHPRSEELRKLAHEATESIKRFPRFKEALAFVNLNGPTGKVVIGNKIDVGYTYSHMTPKTEFKRFAPFSKAVKDKVTKHDKRMEYLDKKRKTQNVTETSGAGNEGTEKNDSGDAQGVGAEGGLGGVPVQGLPTKRPELGEGWTEEEQRAVQEVYSDMTGRFTIKEIVAAAQPLLREELAGEAEPMLRMLRLYEKVQNLDAVNLCSSDQHHNEGDMVCLFKVGEKRVNSDGNEEEVEVWVESQTVPSTDEGSISFSKCALSEGTHEFRYMMAGSDTPACISTSFVTVKPLATIGVPSQVVPCGDPFTVSYAIPLTRPHSPDDWIGIYKLTGYGPNGCVMRISVPDGNEGTIDIEHTPDFPGEYHAKYHLGAHSDAVVGTSLDFEVRLRVPAKGIETREVRIFVCSTVTDMQAEREAIVHHVVPELQKMFESRFLTVTLIPMSWGTRHRTDYARESITLQDLKIGLAEVEACRPFFIAILGERRGAPPPPCDDETIALYPWLRGQRLDRYTLPGKYSSLLELQVLNGFLVQPEAARHAVFYLRDPDFARRAGLDRRELSKYLPDSELGREAVQMLKEELRDMSCVHRLFESTQSLSDSLIDHLKNAIEAEHPPEKWTPARCKSVVNDLIAAHLVSRMTTFHPSFSNLAAQVEAFLEEGPEPVVLKGEAGTGMSTLMAAVAHAHVTALQENEEVDWGEGGKREWGKGSTAFTYKLHGVTHLFLLQHVGHEMSVTTDAEVLEHAMRVSVEELGLDMVIPWHPEDLIDLFAEWMDRVCSAARFTWMIDGVDQMLGANPIEGIYSHEARVKVEAAEKNPRATNRGGGGAVALERETLSDIEDKERHKLLTARNYAQMNLKRWLIPMIDLTSTMCAPTRFPNLHLVLSTVDAEPAELMALLRPLDSSFQLLIDGSRSVPKVIEMQAWGPEPRRKYILQRLQELPPGVPEDTLATTTEYLLHASRPPVEASGADAAVRDRFGVTHFMASCVDDLLSLCQEKASVKVLEEHFVIMDKCDTLEALLLRQLKNLQRRVPGAETAFKMLYLSQVGLREMELLKFVGDKEDVTGEELTMMLRNIQPVTSKVAGYIQLRASYQRCAWRLFKSVDTRLEMTGDMATHFMADTNVIRRAQEMPSLLLRQSKMDQLLEFLSNQDNLPHVGKADVLRYAKAVGWGSEVIALTLKKGFEDHFGVGSAASGKRYDMQKLMEQVESLKLGVLKPEDHTKSQKLAMEESSRVPHEFSVLPSQRRKWMQHNRLLNFCDRSLDTVDLLLRLETSALETAEGMLESLVKFLHQADSLALVSERSTKYPMQSLKGIKLWTQVFSRALSSLPVANADEATSPNMRQDKKAMHHSRAVHELIHAKVKLLMHAVQRIQEDTCTASRWKEVVSGDLLLEVMPEGVLELADDVFHGLKMLMSGEGADDVPKLNLQIAKSRARAARTASINAGH